MISCLDFRRQILSTPDEMPDEFLAHSNACSVCAKFTQEMYEFEHVLRDAVELEVPKELSAQIILNKSIEERRKKALLKKQFLSLAAVLVLSVSAYFLYHDEPSNLTLEQQVVAHLHDHSEPLTARKKVSSDKLVSVAAKADMKLLSPTIIGKLNYIATCRVGKQLGIHLVMQGQYGPVTVIVLHDPVKRKLPIKDDTAKGVLAPFQSGSIAIFGQENENYSEIENEMLKFISVGI